MDNITKQLILTSILLICTAVVICIHFFGQPGIMSDEGIALPDVAFFSDSAFIPPQSTQDNVKESSFAPIRIYGALYCTADCTKLLTAVKIMLMLIAVSLFIKPERYDVEFILNSDGMK